VTGETESVQNNYKCYEETNKGNFLPFFYVCTKLVSKDILFDKSLIDSSTCLLFSNGKQYILVGGKRYQDHGAPYCPPRRVVRGGGKHVIRNTHKFYFMHGERMFISLRWPNTNSFISHVLQNRSFRKIEWYWATTLIHSIVRYIFSVFSFR
jgi:hypothetical protein